jgi:hypothetical protein
MLRNIALACTVLGAHVTTHAQEAPNLHPYLRADIGLGRFLDVEEDEDAPEEFNKVTDDLEKPMEFSIAAGILGSGGRFGIGMFYQRDASEGSTSAPIAIDGGSITSIEASLVSHLYGAQFVGIAPIGEHLDFRGEVGLAKASCTQTIDLDMLIPTSQGTIPGSGKTTFDYAGVAFVAGLGLDFKLTPHVAIGGFARMVQGRATPEEGTTKVTVEGQTMSRKLDLDDEEDSDISSISLSLALRLTL